jgi:hypothetical protein
MNSLRPLQEKIENSGRPIVGEFVNRANSNSLEVFSPSIKLIGCARECPVMGTFIEYLEATNKNDFTMAQNFEGSTENWLTNKINRGEIEYILGEIIGTRLNNRPVLIDDLLIQTDLRDKLEGLTLMVYIDRDELMARTRYNWFLRLSPEQVLNSRTTLAELFLISLNN